jgi:hypothetical protein
MFIHFNVLDAECNADVDAIPQSSLSRIGNAGNEQGKGRSSNIMVEAWLNYGMNLKCWNVTPRRSSKFKWRSRERK